MAILPACRLGAAAIVLAAATMALATPARACACGALMPPPDAQASINHEVALLRWDAATETETIVMQLALDTTTDNVALVVPTPTPATVAAGEKATFEELNTLTAPQHQRHWTVGLALFGGAVEEAAPTGSPEVISQVHLGPLEATTLAGGDLAGLRKWLADNNYTIQPAVSDALGPYVSERWSFVAMRLTSTAPIAGGLDPVRLTFRSSHMVYPMRLSVAAAHMQQVTLFALADHRQQRVDADASAQVTQLEYADRISGAVQDPPLRELVGDHGGYLTRMSVDIYRPSQITSDFAFGNAPNDDPYRLVINDDILIPIDLILLAAVLLAAIVAAVAIPVARRRARKRTARPAQ
ncbi:MAG: DUF2330 domain-containing protein [Mycobacterium sp.]